MSRTTLFGAILAMAAALSAQKPLPQVIFETELGNITMEIELITSVALEEQMRFAIREGGKTVGAGVVTKVIE